MQFNLQGSTDVAEPTGGIPTSDTQPPIRIPPFEEMISVEVETAPGTTRKYRLDQDIPLTDALVLDRRKTIIADIQVDKLAQNLTILTDLVDLAYNAVPEREGALRGSIGKLQFDYGDLCQRCSQAMNDLKTSAASIATILPGAFKYLFEGDEDLALGDLSDCAKIAGKLAERMKGLADEFDKLAKAADDSLEKSETRRGEEITEKEKLEKARDSLKAKKSGLDVIRTKIADLIKDLEVQFKDAKERLDLTEDRAFAVALTGAILKPIGEGLGGAATALALVYSGGPRSGPPQPPQNAPAPPPKPDGKEPKVTPEQQADFDRAKDGKATAEKQLAQVEADVSILDAELAVLTEELTQAKGEQAETLRKEKATVQNALDKGNTAKTGKVKDLEAAKQKYDSAATMIKALGVTLASAGEGFSQMGHDYLEVAESQRKQVGELRTLLMEKKDIERNALAEIEEATTRLSSLSVNIDSSAVTIAALFQVIAALRKVADILHDAAAFWRAMQTACESLGKPDYMDQLTRRMKKLGTPMERVAKYDNDNRLKRQFLLYMVGWRSLETVAEEYRKSTETIYKAAREKRSTTLPRDQAQARVVSLSAKLLKTIGEEKKQVTAEKQTLENLGKAA